MRFLFRLTLLGLVFGSTLSVSAQPVLIDDFDTDLPPLIVSSQNGTFPVDNGTSLVGNSIGGETDIILSLLNATTPNAQAQVSIQNGALQFNAPDGTTSRTVLAWDGVDGDPFTINVSQGFVPVDLTQGNTQSGLDLPILSNAGPIDVGIVLYSSVDDNSELVRTIPPTDSPSIVSFPFDEFQPNPGGSGADLSNIRAILAILGADEDGAQGPVDLNIPFFTSVDRPVQDIIDLLDQIDNPIAPGIRAVNFPGDNPFDQEVLDDLIVDGDGPVQVTGIDFVGGFSPAAPSDPTIGLTIYNMENGHPTSDILRKYPTLSLFPVDLSLFSVQLPGPLELPPGHYGFGLQGNVPVGTELRIQEALESGDLPYMVRNPGGALAPNCRDWEMGTNCGGQNPGLAIQIKGFSILDIPRFAPTLTKTASRDTLVVGDTLTYTLTLTTEQPLSRPEISDILPEGMELISAKLTKPDGSDVFCDVSLFFSNGDKLVTCMLDEDLEPGEIAVMTIVARVTRDGKQTNNGQAHYDDFSSGRLVVKDSVSVVVLPRNLEIEKSAPEQDYSLGEVITYAITIHNPTSDPVSGVRIIDDYPRWQLEYYEFSSDPACGHDDETSILVCDVGTLDSGETRTINVTFRAFGRGNGDLSNTIEVTSDDGFEGRDSEVVSLEGGINAEMAYYLASKRRSSNKTSTHIDVYLDDVRIGDDLEVGAGTGFETITLAAVKPMLYIVPGDAPDRSAAVDSFQVDLFTESGDIATSALLVLTVDSTKSTQVLVRHNPRTTAADPAQVDLITVHATPSLPALKLDARTDPPATVENLEYGGFSDYISTAPGAYNLSLTSAGTTTDVFRADLSSPGQVYVMAIAPDSASGKQTLLPEGYRVFVFDGTGNAIETALVTSAEPETGIPTDFALHKNYPNPFNPVTTIEYALPKNETVNLSIYNMLGQRVKTLVSGPVAAGRYQARWNGTDETGAVVPSGLYFYRLSAGDFYKTRQMVLLK